MKSLWNLYASRDEMKNTQKKVKNILQNEIYYAFYKRRKAQGVESSRKFYFLPLLSRDYFSWREMLGKKREQGKLTPENSKEMR